MISVEKVTLNMGVGADSAKIPKAKKLLEKLTGQKPIERKTIKRIPTWGLRKNMIVGVMVTLRGKKADEILRKCLKSKDNQIKEASFAKDGNFSFGIKSYIEIPGEKYDPEIGLLGFDVCITLNKWGYRNKKRKIGKAKVPKRHVITKNEAIEFAKKEFEIEVVQ